METRLRHLFLILLLTVLTLGSPVLKAQETGQNEELVTIEPDIERSEFDEALIDSEDFELMLNLGYLSIEDFGVNTLIAINLNYHVDEDFFIQFGLGESKGGLTSYEVLSGGAPLLTDSERDYSYYRINIGYNLLPGEAFLTQQITYNTAFYLTAGIGITQFAGDDRFTINYGAGYRFLLYDALALYTTFHNDVMDMDIFGETKTTNNLAFTLGISWFF